MTSAIPQSALPKFGQLIRLIHEAHITAEAAARARHERFNVFTTVLSETDEVRLHTRFLKTLLDPQDCHDCGNLFLDLFFETLNELPGLDHDDKEVPLNCPASKILWRVDKEQSRAPYGQIDLLLERVDFGIAIENKIYAREQERQVESYATYLETRYDSRWAVIYLTIDGKKSGTHGGKRYIRISYQKHIVAWLGKCLRATYSVVPVNQALQQYLKVVRSVVGDTLDLSAMKPITEFILQNPDIIRYRKQVELGINEVIAGFVNQVMDGIMNELQKEGFRCLVEKGPLGKDPHGSIVVAPPNGSLMCDASFQIWIEREDQIIAVGLCTSNVQSRVTPHHKTVFKRMDELMKLDAIQRNYHKFDATDNWPVGWQNFIEGLNDDAAVASLIEKPIEQTICTTYQTIRCYLAAIERVYSEAASTR